MTAIVTLTSDFGTRDSYVAELKAAVLEVTRAVHLIDVTHEVERHQVAEAALTLEAAAASFPRGTIHLAVVDPGVGTARRGLVIATDHGLFVGPDNGLFTPIFVAGRWRAFELAAPEYRRPHVSRTFHGRDIFAPAAGHLALGVPPERFGPAITDPVVLGWAQARDVAGGVSGVVIHIDRFGNLVTSITADRVEGLLAGPGVPPRVRIAGRTLPLVGTYGDLPRGGLGALVGSRRRLEVAAREGSAAATLRARRGTPVVVSRTTWRAPRPTTT